MVQLPQRETERIFQEVNAVQRSEAPAMSMGHPTSWLTCRIRRGKNPPDVTTWSLKFELYSSASPKNLSNAMMNDHSFSALDRHAVLSGSDDGFPWFASAMLAVESAEVVRLRLEKLASDDGDAEQEARLMVSEKFVAAFEAATSWLAGATPAAIIGRYREHVAANAKRLSA
jgi:hypothetical protein